MVYRIKKYKYMILVVFLVTVLSVVSIVMYKKAQKPAIPLKGVYVLNTGALDSAT